MKVLITALIVALLSGTAAIAEDDACDVVAPLVSADFALQHVAAAINDHHLNVVVVGSASSTLAGSAGTKEAFPARLEAALTAKLAGVAVKVTSYVKARQTALDMTQQFDHILATDKPTLVIWQTGTVDAMRHADPDEFAGALDTGISALQAGRSDVILMNMQYSPRTESMIAVAPYAEVMRIVALQHEILLFDRFAIMKHWSELGTFDLNEITKKIDTAGHVHDCIGRLLGRLIVEAAKLTHKANQSLN